MKAGKKQEEKRQQKAEAARQVEGIPAMGEDITARIIGLMRKCKELQEENSKLHATVAELQAKLDLLRN